MPCLALQTAAPDLDEAQNSVETEGLERVTLKTAQALIELGPFNERLMEDKVLLPIPPLVAPGRYSLSSACMQFLLFLQMQPARGRHLYEAIGDAFEVSSLFLLSTAELSWHSGLSHMQAFLRVNPHRLRDLMRLSSPETHLDEKCKCIMDGRGQSSLAAAAGPVVVQSWCLRRLRRSSRCPRANATAPWSRRKTWYVSSPHSCDPL